MRLNSLLALGPVLLVACTAAQPDDHPQILGGGPTGPAKLQTGSTPSLDGNWTWTSMELVRMPPFVAGLVGINPEGPNTQARCTGEGTMNLMHAGGGEFTGTATRTVSNCRTTGGQVFAQPGSGFQIAQGVIKGQSVAFAWNAPTVSPCPYRAVMSSIADGIVTALRGTGHCLLPGHPQSESPLPFEPPPGGTSTTVEWTATR